MKNLKQSGGLKEILYIFLVIFYFLLFAYPLLTDYTYDPLHQARYGTVFFDMYHRLMRGDVGIDLSLIGTEKFVVHGRIISYFLPFPALVRGFFSLFHLGQYPLPSIFLGLLVYCVSIYFLFKNVLKLLPCKEADAMLFAWYPFFLLPMISLLVEASIYWEDIIWAFAMFMAQAALFFTYLTDRRVLNKCALMLVSSLVLFTRPTFAFAAAVLVVILFFDDIKLKHRSIPHLWPYGIFFVSLLLLAWLNYQRWGNPFEFCDLRDFGLSIGTKRGEMALTEPTFSILRVPLSIKYYFFAVKSNFCPHMPFVKIGGQAVPSYGLYDYVEPSYPLILLLPVYLLAGCAGLWGVISKRIQWNLNGYGYIKAYYLVSLIPVVFILSVLYMALRYRCEFFAFLVFSSMIGIVYLQSAFDKVKIFRWAILTTVFSFLLVVYGLFVERCFWTVAGLPVRNPSIISHWFGREAFDPSLYTHYVFKT